MTKRTKKHVIGISIIAFGAAVLGVALAIGLTGGQRFTTVPDAGAVRTETAARFLVSEKMTSLPPAEKYRFLEDYALSHDNDADRQAVIDTVAGMSDGQVAALRNNIADALTFKLLADAAEYNRLTTTDQRAAFVRESADRLMRFEQWKQALRRSAELRSRLPATDKAFLNTLLKRTTPTEQAQLQAFMVASFQQHLADKADRLTRRSR